MAHYINQINRLPQNFEVELELFLVIPKMCIFVYACPNFSSIDQSSCYQLRAPKCNLLAPCLLCPAILALQYPYPSLYQQPPAKYSIWSPPIILDFLDYLLAADSMASLAQFCSSKTKILAVLHSKSWTFQCLSPLWTASKQCYFLALS